MDSIIKEAIENLEDRGVEITIENIKNVLNKWINNLYSYVGVETHKRFQSYGIQDETGLSWHEQDLQSLQKIMKIQKCVEQLSKSATERRLAMNFMCIPDGFIIRKKSDCDRFMNECMVDGCEYVIKTNEELAVFFEKKNNVISVAEKYWDLNDPFNPVVEVVNTNNAAYKETVQDYVWKYRKYINAKWFNKKD